MPWLAVAACLLLLAALYAVLTGVSAVMVTVTGACDGTVFAFLVAEGSRLTVSFVHSVHLSPERDVLAVTRTGFYLVEVAAEDLGAGVPSSPSELGGGVSVEGPLVAYRGLWAYRGHVLRIDIGNAVNMTVSLGALSFNASSCSLLVLSVG